MSNHSVLSLLVTFATVVIGFQLSTIQIASSFSISSALFSSKHHQPHRHNQRTLFTQRQRFDINTNDNSKQLQATQKQDESIEEEAARLAEEAITKTRSMSKLQNERGIQYAPWMGIQPEDAERIKGIMKEKAEARRRRDDEEKKTKGSLLRDSAFQELSGTGLKSKIVDGTSVELEWATGSEADTKGFLVKRRTQKSGGDYEVIASHETYGPLASKGVNGGVYRYLDTNLEPGAGYFYRITECDKDGEENDLSQCLVEIQTQEEATVQKIALIGFALVAVAAIVGSLALDPLQ